MSTKLATIPRGQTFLARCFKHDQDIVHHGEFLRGDAATVGSLGGAAIQRELTETLNFLNRPTYRNRSFEEGTAVARQVNIDYSITEVAAQRLTGSGRSSRLNGGTTSINVGQISIGEDAVQVEVFGLEYEGTYIGRARADRSMGPTGESYVQVQGSETGEVIKADVNEYIAYGVPAEGLTGFYNDPAVTVSGTTLDLTDFNSATNTASTLIQEFIGGNSFNMAGFRWMIAPRLYGALASLYPTNGANSALSAIMDSNQGLGLQDIVAIPEGQRALASGEEGLPSGIGTAGQDRNAFVMVDPTKMLTKGSVMDQFPEVQTSLGYKAVLFEVTSQFMLLSAPALLYHDTAAP